MLHGLCLRLGVLHYLVPALEPDGRVVRMPNRALDVNLRIARHPTARTLTFFIRQPFVFLASQTVGMTVVDPHHLPAGPCEELAHVRLATATLDGLIAEHLTLINVQFGMR